jgi:hypothetical protein
MIAPCRPSYPNVMSIYKTYVRDLIENGGSLQQVCSILIQIPHLIHEEKYIPITPRTNNMTNLIILGFIKPDSNQFAFLERTDPDRAAVKRGLKSTLLDSIWTRYLILSRINCDFVVLSALLSCSIWLCKLSGSARSSLKLLSTID